MTLKSSPMPPRKAPMPRSSRPTGILAQASHQLAAKKAAENEENKSKLPMMAKKLRAEKVPKCAVKTCRAPFTPERPFITWCSPECGAVVALALVADKAAKAAKADRIETKRKLDGFKSIPHLKAELQDIFNEFIRLRDDELPCICCGKWPKGGAALSGGQWDAAHWKGRGAADHLRFNEDNVHKALKDCNEFGHTDYRGGLVRKIGLVRVEALESDHALVKWTREWLEEKKTEYRAKLKQLKGKN